MQKFEIRLFIDNIEQTLEIQEEKSGSGIFVVTENLKFVARIFKDADGQWKSKEISDLSPSVIEAIGKEIDTRLGDILP